MGREVQAEAIDAIDGWCDTMNSRSPYDKLKRYGYGISPITKTAKDSSLDRMNELVQQARSVTKTASRTKDSATLPAWRTA